MGVFTTGGVTVTDVTATTVSLSYSGTTGGTPPYSLQWQISLDDVTFYDLPGATTADYTDTDRSPGGTYYYRMKVTDADLDVDYSDSAEAILAEGGAPFSYPLALCCDPCEDDDDGPPCEGLLCVDFGCRQSEDDYWQKGIARRGNTTITQVSTGRVVTACNPYFAVYLPGTGTDYLYADPQAGYVGTYPPKSFWPGYLMSLPSPYNTHTWFACCWILPVADGTVWSVWGESGSRGWRLRTEGSDVIFEVTEDGDPEDPPWEVATTLTTESDGYAFVFFGVRPDGGSGYELFIGSADDAFEVAAAPSTIFESSATMMMGRQEDSGDVQAWEGEIDEPVIGSVNPTYATSEGARTLHYADGAGLHSRQRVNTPGIAWYFWWSFEDLGDVKRPLVPFTPFQINMTKAGTLTEPLGHVDGHLVTDDAKPCCMKLRDGMDGDWLIEYDFTDYSGYCPVSTTVTIDEEEICDDHQASLEVELSSYYFNIVFDACGAGCGQYYWAAPYTITITGANGVVATISGTTSDEGYTWVDADLGCPGPTLPATVHTHITSVLPTINDLDCTQTISCCTPNPLRPCDPGPSGCTSLPSLKDDWVCVCSQYGVPKTITYSDGNGTLEMTYPHWSGAYEFSCEDSAVCEPCPSPYNPFGYGWKRGTATIRVFIRIDCRCDDLTGEITWYVYKTVSGILDGGFLCDNEEGWPPAGVTILAGVRPPFAGCYGGNIIAPWGLATSLPQTDGSLSVSGELQPWIIPPPYSCDVLGPFTITG